MFGVSLILFAHLILEVAPRTNQDFDIINFISSSYMLFFYLRNHPILDVAGIMFRPIGKTTYRNKLYEVMEYWKTYNQINFDMRLQCPKIEFDDGKFFYIAVDSTDIPLNYQSQVELRQGQQWSSKNHQYSVKIETGVTMDGYIVWYHGYFYHNFHDVSIYRVSLKSVLGPMEYVVADLGYRGEERCLVPKMVNNDEEKLSDEDTAYNEWISGYRAIVENMNATLKKWSILCWYNGEDLDFLMDAFILIANIINLKKEKLFEDKDEED